VKLAYRLLGLVAVALGVIGIFLAAFFFARSNPAWERRILEHPRFGPPVRAWRERGAIGRRAKAAALMGLGGSAVLGLWLVEGSWRFVPLGVAVIVGTWIATRPE
jgi:uncharacterized protein